MVCQGLYATVVRMWQSFVIYAAGGVLPVPVVFSLMSCFQAVYSVPPHSASACPWGPANERHLDAFPGRLLHGIQERTRQCLAPGADWHMRISVGHLLPSGRLDDQRAEAQRRGDAVCATHDGDRRG